MAILSLVGISKSFAQRGIVLDDLSLDADEGDMIAIMGPSGSGKTTLMNIIGLLDKPDSGTVSFIGKNIIGLDDNASAIYRNQNVGFVFQEHLLLPHLTISENIFLPLMASRQGEEEAGRKMAFAKTLMAKTGIAELAGRYPARVSGGEAQRAALVRALVNHPSVLLADEPTGSLDSGNAERMGDLLAEINREYNITLILATHSEGLAGKMKRILRLVNGKLK